MMELPIQVSDVISFLALSVSAYVAWQQYSLSSSQKRLNELLLQQGEGQVREAQSADLDASFVKIGNGKLRLKIWNKGKATAKNVRVEFPDGDDFVITSDVENKFPLELLHQHQSVEIVAFINTQSKLKHHVKIIWDDNIALDRSKSTYPTI